MKWEEETCVIDNLQQRSQEASSPRQRSAGAFSPLATIH